MNIDASDVIPAKAGIPFFNAVILDPRFRGDDELLLRLPCGYSYLFYRLLIAFASGDTLHWINRTIHELQLTFQS